MYMNSDINILWPAEKEENDILGYPYPYQIENVDEWKKKDVTVNSSDNVMYSIKNEFDIIYKKQEIEFDPNRSNLFRVSLIPKP